tara:strand:+ start:1731 stop:2006 length:276 start_codon:yes stop_codon:yes gene_type:complete
MPRYLYECEACDHIDVFFHGMNESVGIPEVCPKCLQKTMKKVFKNSFSLNKKSTAPQPKKVGDVTKDHIEQNKEILKNQKKQAKEQTYDPS